MHWLELKKPQYLEGGWMVGQKIGKTDGCLIFTLPCVLQAIDTLGPLPKKANLIPEMVDFRPERTELRPKPSIRSE